MELEGDWSADTAGRMNALIPSQLHQRALHAPWRPLAAPVSVAAATHGGQRGAYGRRGSVGSASKGDSSGGGASGDASAFLTFRRLAPCTRIIEFPPGRRYASFAFFRAVQRIMTGESGADVWGLAFRDSTLEQPFCDALGEALKTMPEVRRCVAPADRRAAAHALRAMP